LSSPPFRCIPDGTIVAWISRQQLMARRCDSLVNTEADDAPRALVHDNEHPIRAFGHKIQTPQIVLRMVRTAWAWRSARIQIPADDVLSKSANDFEQPDDWRSGNEQFRHCRDQAVEAACIKTLSIVAGCPHGQEGHHQAIILGQDFRTLVPGLIGQIVFHVAEIPLDGVLGYRISGVHDAQKSEAHSAPPFCSVPLFTRDLE